MIDHTHHRWKLFFKRYILNFAFKNPTFYTTVNNASAIEEYQHKYKYLDRKRIYILHDCYQHIPISNRYNPGGKYILCIGNIRDWETFFNVAERMPDYRFVGVGRRHKIIRHLNNIPANVEMYFDVCKTEADRLLHESQIILIPLSSNVTNGLTILFQAACNYKPIICTDTPTIRDICTLRDGSHGAAFVGFGDIDGIMEKIEMLANNETEITHMCDTMLKAIQKYSPENYAYTLYMHSQKISGKINGQR